MGKVYPRYEVFEFEGLWYVCFSVPDEEFSSVIERIIEAFPNKDGAEATCDLLNENLCV